MYKLLIITALTLSGLITNAQNALPQWTAFYNTPGDNSDRFNKIIPDGTGNFIAIGYTIKPGNYRDFLVARLNNNGDTLWWRTKNGVGNFDDEAIGVSLDPNGNIYAVGNTDGGISGTDIMVLEYDINGTLLWTYTWNSIHYMDDLAMDIKTDINGNCIIGGITEPDTVTGSNDYITFKLSPSGNLLWQHIFSRAGTISKKDELAAIAVDGNGDVYVTGRSSNGNDDDYATLKYNGSTGAQLWLQIYNSGNGTDRATCITLDNTGNVIVSGRSNNGNNDDFRTLKYNANGVLQWTKAFNGASNQNDRAIGIRTDASNNVFIFGESDIDVSTNINLDYSIVKYNSAGIQQWSRIIGTPANQDDVPSDVAIASNGDIFLTGKSDQDPSSNTNNDYFTIKLNSTGATQWQNLYSGTDQGQSDIASSIVIDGNNAIIVGGATNIGSQKDATIVKYDASGTLVFSKDHNGPGDKGETAKKVIVDPNGNAFVAGYAFNVDNNRDAVLVKFDPSGNQICNVVFRGVKGDDDEFEKIALASDGSLYACGYTKVSGQKSNMLLVKIDPSGCAIDWTFTYDFVNKSDRAVDLVLDSSNNIYITGRSDQSTIDTVENNDIVTMKLDLAGNVIWSQRFNGSGNLRDEPAKILLDNAGEVVVAGRTENIHDDDYIVIKYNVITGNPVWNNPATYNGPFSNDDRVTDMIIDATDHIYTCGYSQTGSGASPEDVATISYSSAGTVDGFFGYDGLGQGNDRPIKIGFDARNAIYTAIKTDVDPNPITSNYNILLVKTDNTLLQLWMTDWDDVLSKDDEPIDMVVGVNGEVYITGSAESDTIANTTNQNWQTLRFDSSGVINYSANYDGPNQTDDAPNSMFIRGTEMWVAGYTEGIGSQKDLTLTKYDLTSSIQNPFGTTSFSLYPNPVTSNSTLKVSSEKLLTVTVRDGLGKEVKVVSSYSPVTISKTDLSPGIYYFTIHSESKIMGSGKFIIQ